MPHELPTDLAQDSPAFEQCDDGNEDNTDACPETCQPARCGDGFVQAGVESCDDGNTIAGDGCALDCVLEGCGNSRIEPGEGCDDGNLNAGDGCDAECRLESCGNERIDPGETCDDGNLVDEDACTNLCQIAACGDGIVRQDLELNDEGYEACDDANESDFDACVNGCVVARCGDGFVRSGTEQCDDANDEQTDACLNNCTAASCGDGFLRAGLETCDDGNANAGGDCTNQCTVARCGDGVLRQGEEQCDDGNAANDDGCLNGCITARCGDGIVRRWFEACDDGNANANDGCTECVLDTCGNQQLDDGEECDGGERCGINCIENPGVVAEHPAPSCQVIKHVTPGAIDGIYWLQTHQAPAFEAYCDMTANGGGWTLLFQRRGGDRNVENREEYGTDFGHFVANSGGTAAQIGYANSYSMGRDRWPANTLEYRIVQYAADMTPDLDDAMVLRSASNPFRAGGLEVTTTLTQACDHNAENCVEAAWFRFLSDRHVPNATCTDHVSLNSGYGGHWIICPSERAGRSMSLFGNRDYYNENKLWGLDSLGNGYVWAERVFAR